MQPNFDALYRALVTSTTDPTNSRKIKVQCPQIGGLAEIREAEPVNPKVPTPSVGSTVWVGFSGGDVTKPYYFSNTEYWNGGSTSLSAESPTTTAYPDSSFIALYSGLTGQTVSSANGPTVFIADGDSNSAVNLYVSGAVVPTDIFSDPYTWQTPSYNTNWADGSTASSSYQGLRFRMMEDDSIWLFGSAHATAATPSNTVFTLPTGYRPQKLANGGTPAIMPAGSLVSTTSADALKLVGRLNVQDSGAVVIGGFTVASGDNFYFNHKIPLGNLA